MDKNLKKEPYDFLYGSERNALDWFDDIDRFARNAGEARMFNHDAYIFNLQRLETSVNRETYKVKSYISDLKGYNEKLKKWGNDLLAYVEQLEAKISQLENQDKTKEHE